VQQCQVGATRKEPQTLLGAGAKAVIDLDPREVTITYLSIKNTTAKPNTWT